MSPSTTGARSATGRTHKPLGWLPWIAVAILAVVIVAVVLVVVRVNDDDTATAITPAAGVLVPAPARTA